MQLKKARDASLAREIIEVDTKVVLWRVRDVVVEGVQSSAAGVVEGRNGEESGRGGEG